MNVVLLVSDFESFFFQKEDFEVSEEIRELYFFSKEINGKH